MRWRMYGASCQPRRSDLNVVLFNRVGGKIWCQLILATGRVDNEMVAIHNEHNQDLLAICMRLEIVCYVTRQRRRGHDSL